MPPSKIDTLIAALSDFSESVGEFRAGISNLKGQADRDRNDREREREQDRNEREREHRENQESMAGLRQNTTLAIAELRQAAVNRWEGAEASINNLSVKLDEHAKAVNAMQVSRGKLAALAAVGLFALWIIGQALEVGVQQLFAWGFRKFGG